MEENPDQLRGRTVPWGRGATLALAALVLFGLWLRLRGLSAEGFGDDEVHKWLAANRYLQGVFSGDDVEHPMLLKRLIAGSIAIGSRLGWAPETMTRLPNALAGGASVVVVALLARRLFGRTAASLAGMLASKYFFFLTPVPVVFYLWVRRDTQWRVPLRRWLQLVGVAALLWVCVNWSPFLPSTWEYAKSYTTGQQTVHGSLFFMGRIYHNLLEYGLRGTPPWFYAVFAAVKLAPATFLFALAGLAVALTQRRPAHKLLLSWLAVWFIAHSVSGSKWGRFFVSVLPAFLILAGQTGAMLIGLLKKPAPRWAAIAAAVLLLPGAEAFAAVEHAPHYRLYISPLGGGDARVQWYFPHCDYFDAGFREAVQYVAAHAEPDAELSTEIDWPAKLYAEKAGRQDLQQT